MAQAPPAGGAGGAPSFTLIPAPRAGESAVADADFRAFYESLDEFAPTVRPSQTLEALFYGLSRRLFVA